MKIGIREVELGVAAPRWPEVNVERTRRAGEVDCRGLKAICAVEMFGVVWNASTMPGMPKKSVDHTALCYNSLTVITSSNKELYHAGWNTINAHSACCVSGCTGLYVMIRA